MTFVQRTKWIVLFVALILPIVVIGSAQPSISRAAPAISNPILFVTQVPIPGDFTTIGSTFGNHRAALDSVGRGGDLWIRYPDGSLKNLTEAAGYGTSGFQGDTAIAVRQPAVHWNGTKAVFSMVVGATEAQYEYEDYYWQLYEITGLGPSDTPVITKVPNQPPDYNNISPIYGTNGRIIFTSDRPRNGQRHLYPQLDEYEEAPTNTGLWSLDPVTGNLFLLDHAPSGDFTPTIDSFGRVIFTRWDHLQRDQQADSDALDGGNCTYCTFNYASEAANAAILNDNSEVFPEPRAERTDLLAGTNLEGHSFNQFFPWMATEDGTDQETLNHIGRHELHSYFNRSFNDDPNLIEFYNLNGLFNQNRIENMFHIREDPANPGTYYGINAPEFYTHAAGQIISLNGAPSVDADQMAVTYITHHDTANPDNTPSANHSGLYRNPLPLTNGELLAVHTAETRQDQNEGSRANPQSRYDFRIKTLTFNGSYWLADQPITTGISKSISYWDPDVLVSYSGELWELDPVEVVAQPLPPTINATLPGLENQVFQEEGVNLAAFQAYLVQNNLAVVVSRNVTTRDDADEQQPYNLRIAGGGAQTIGSPGKIYDVAAMQFFQADQIRGLGYGDDEPRAGRRVLAQALHAPNVFNPPNPGGPAGSVKLSDDGSMAAFVPARRAMTWQLTDPAGDGVVRERYWLTFQPGEIRVCTSCHGLNENNQAGQGFPQNKPEALRELLQFWQTLQNVEPAVYLPLIVR
jgi:hypothetical protein